MTQPRPSSPPPHRVRRGFTLVEMLIVIGVILVLSALTLMATAAFVRASEVRQTRNVLTVLDQAIGEWQIAADREMSYGPNPAAPATPVYDLDQSHIEPGYPTSRAGAHFDDTAFDLLGILQRNQSAREIVANIDPEFLTELTDEDNVDRLGVRDAWDHTIRAVFPGRKWYSGDFGQSDADGTIRTLMERVHGVCIDRRIYFVSAGPDGEFGDLSLDIADESSFSEPQREEYEAAGDNIYSYEPLREREP